MLPMLRTQNIICEYEPHVEGKEENYVGLIHKGMSHTWLNPPKNNQSQRKVHRILGANAVKGTYMEREGQQSFWACKPAVVTAIMQNGEARGAMADHILKQITREICLTQLFGASTTTLINVYHKNVGCIPSSSVGSN